MIERVQYIRFPIVVLQDICRLCHLHVKNLDDWNNVLKSFTPVRVASSHLGELTIAGACELVAVKEATPSSLHRWQCSANRL